MSSNRRGALAALVVGGLSLLLCGCSIYHVPGSRVITSPVTVCPEKSVIPGATTESGAAQQLVPFAPTEVSLCRYTLHGKPFGAYLVESAPLLGRGVAAKLAAELNRAVSPFPGGTVNCPADTGARVDAYFWTATHHIEVDIRTDGCETANNGTQTNAFVGKSNITLQLSAAIRAAQPSPAPTSTP
jgi:hypothetical protein